LGLEGGSGCEHIHRQVPEGSPLEQVGGQRVLHQWSQ
jgi:hypothetical protein